MCGCHINYEVVLPKTQNGYENGEQFPTLGLLRLQLKKPQETPLCGCLEMTDRQ
jgi:hypothetical protein